VAFVRARVCDGARNMFRLDTVVAMARVHG
jgi:hypothetical protein